MDKMKRVASSLSACLLTAALLAGCGGGSKATGQKKSADSVPANVKLTWYQVNNATPEVSNYGNIKGIQEIEKATGVSITFQHPAVGTDSNEQINLVIASNQLPDVIFWDWNSMPGGISKYIQNGTIIKLNSLIDKDCPNYKASLNKYTQCKKYATLDDGTLPGFYQLDPDSKRTAYAGFILRNDWLTKLGLSTPTTIDEWHTVLNAFKTKDPNGNGKADEIPWTQAKGSAYANFAEAYGILDGMYRDPSTGKVKYGPIETGYKSFITTMAQWYKEGLIDPDFATNDSNAYNARVLNNLSGATYGYVGSTIGNMTKSARTKNPSFSLVGIDHPKSSAGKAYASDQSVIMKVGQAAAITKSCKYPAAAAKFIDYVYSEKGEALMNYGIENESYAVKDGKNVFTDQILNNSQGKSAANAALDYCLPITGWTKVMDYNAYSQINLTLTEQTDAVTKWAKADSSLLIAPSVQFTTEESSEYSDIMNDVTTYVNQEELKFIMGAEPLSNLDSFVSKVKAMNVDQAIKIEQKAVDRMNARK